MAQEMDSLVYDTMLDVGAYPEVAPPTLRGRTCLLGKYYQLPQQAKEFNADVSSRLWMTYRRGFRAISGTSLTSDSGWGCTLRCGQMIVAQALLNKHLGRDWRWKPATVNHTYNKILRMFLDDRDSEYSIQMIALQGADFGRPAGQWLGPNNVAQAVKKLSVHDRWTEMAVHVAMDMCVVIEDMKSLCQQPVSPPGEVNVTTESKDLFLQQKDVEKRLRAISDGPLTTSRLSGASNPPPSSVVFGNTKPQVQTNSEQSLGISIGGSSKVVRQRSLQHNFKKVLLKDEAAKSKDFSVLDSYRFSHSLSLDGVNGLDSVTGVEEESAVAGVGRVPSTGSDFRPLLLFIPLRLGQETFNMEYAAPLKACLTLPQSVGFIGGRPRHAQYFIGFHEDDLWYLDPHTTQTAVNPCDSHLIPDLSYHCQRADRMSISELDPSIALGFFCKDEADIDDLCSRLKKEVLALSGYYSLFELTEKRPSYWGPMERFTFNSVREPFLLVDETDGIPLEDGDDEAFEIISWPVHTDTQN